MCSFDSYLWQMVENKQKFVAQIMTSKNPSRDMDDVDAFALNYAEVKAIASGNPAIRRKMELEIEIGRLKVLEQEHMKSKYALQDKIASSFPSTITRTESKIKDLGLDIVKRNENSTEDFTIKLGKEVYTDKQKSGEMILRACRSGRYVDKAIGEYRGFVIYPQAINWVTESPKIILKGAIKHEVELSASDTGSIQRMDNFLERLEAYKKSEQEILKDTMHQLEIARNQVNNKFEYETELSGATTELTKVNNSLDIGKEDNSNLIDENRYQDNENLANDFIIEEVEEMEDFEMELA